MKKCFIDKKKNIWLIDKNGITCPRLGFFYKLELSTYSEMSQCGSYLYIVIPNTPPTYQSISPVNSVAQWLFIDCISRKIIYAGKSEISILPKDYDIYPSKMIRPYTTRILEQEDKTKVSLFLEGKLVFSSNFKKRQNFKLISNRQVTRGQGKSLPFAANQVYFRGLDRFILISYYSRLSFFGGSMKFFIESLDPETGNISSLDIDIPFSQLEYLSVFSIEPDSRGISGILIHTERSKEIRTLIFNSETQTFLKTKKIKKVQKERKYFLYQGNQNFLVSSTGEGQYQLAILANLGEAESSKCNLI